MSAAKKVYIKTFGCQMNEYDSARIADLLRVAERMELAQSPDEADLILFNTCSVREKAQEKVFHHLGRWKELKKTKPDLLIAVGGCVASQEGAALVRRAPHVDLVFGPQTLHRLPQLIQLRRATGRPQVDVSFPEIEKFDHLPAARIEGVTAFVSVMEGCSKYCTYCVVPYTRGEEVSRPVGDVLAEVAGLAAGGVREVTLLGQNVNAYRGLMDDGEAADFALLLTYVARIPGIERVRYTTSHPVEFTQRLIDAYAALPKLVSHLHLPVQSGSDRVLAAMKRGYSVLEYKSIVRRLRAVRPGMAISTDFIVGFPGESDEDFERTLDYVKTGVFANAYMFVYSQRRGTPAASWEPVAEAVASARFKRLAEAQNAASRAYHDRKIGTTVRCLSQGPSKKDRSKLAAKTLDNVTVIAPAPPEYLATREPWLDVEIDAAHVWGCSGTILRRCARYAEAGTAGS